MVTKWCTQPVSVSIRVVIKYKQCVNVTDYKPVNRQVDITMILDINKQLMSPLSTSL